MSSPFHEGERAVQVRAGVREQADRIARIITGEITGKTRAYLATTQLAVLATLDETGQPWASLLTGPEGFPEIIDGRTVALEPENQLDPLLVSNLRTNPEAGMPGMDLSPRRRRVRMNGEATPDSSGRRHHEPWRHREAGGGEPREVGGLCPYLRRTEGRRPGQVDYQRTPTGVVPCVFRVHLDLLSEWSINKTRFESGSRHFKKFCKT